MHEIIQIFRDALPETLGGLIVAAILGMLGLVYRNLLRKKNKPPVLNLTKEELKLFFKSIDVTDSFETDKNKLRVIVESIHSGEKFDIWASPKQSIESLTELAQSCLKVNSIAIIEYRGGKFKFMIKWVLVDAKAEKQWRRIKRSTQRRLRALIKTEKGFKKSLNDWDTLEEIGIYDGIVLHLHAVEDKEIMAVKASTGADTARIGSNRTRYSSSYETYEVPLSRKLLSWINVIVVLPINLIIWFINLFIYPYNFLSIRIRRWMLIRKTLREINSLV